MPSWKFIKSPLSSNASKSSLCLPSDTRGSPIYHDPAVKAQATSSELRLDQQNIRRLQSKPSHLNQSAKPPSNFSADSFHTADQDQLSDSSRPSQRSGQSQPLEDATQTTMPNQEDTAKSFADRAWAEDPTFVDREKLVEWLGSPSEIRQQTLGYYMSNFNFAGVNIDEAIRRLCHKLYIKGETQQIDRILESFNIVHVVTFAIILLNTDLQAAELQAHITNNRFVDNTIEAIRSQLREPSLNVTTPTHEKLTVPEHLPDIQELPQTPSTPVPFSKSSAPPNLERHASNVARDRQGSVGSIPFNRDSWVVPAHPAERGERNSLDMAGSERWLLEVSRELSTIYNNVRNKPILQPKPEDSPTSPQSKGRGGFLRHGSTKLYHSLRGESPYAQSSPSASGASFVSALGHRVSSSMSSLPQFLGLTSSPSLSSSTNADPSRSPDSRWVKTGPLLWKSMKPTTGRISKPKRWVSVIATARNSLFDMNGPPPPGTNSGAGRKVGTLPLLHALAQEVPAPKNSRVRSFSLTLSTGEAHMFEIQIASTGPPGGLFKSKSKPSGEADAEVHAWVRACNYHAARYSRAPLPDGVTNIEYGWNGAVAPEEDDQSSVSGGKTRNTLIDDWVAPAIPLIETQLDAEAQLEAWNHQINLCNSEFAEHGELRGRMMNLYKPGSVQAQKALSNWERKAQYLLTEIVKYEIYAETLKNTELATPSSA
ncbi:Sec7 guanine nucleotide exchange factor [Ceratobasidium sp. AG-Ba]|nr:Sec7 guanine nucleotide exchange factor [Ceratobasidium sp. AG-Ba]